MLDRWVLSELNELVGKVDAAMAAFDTHETGKLLAGFVDDLSNWYVRRSRRRFWRGDPAALATLHEALRVDPRPASEGPLEVRSQSMNVRRVP